MIYFFRFIEFGKQIAKNVKIINYSSCNALWQEIKQNPADTWRPYKEKYQNLHNE